LAKTLISQGYDVFTWKECESRLRGGQNSYSIRVGEKPRNALLSQADILLALNKGALKKYRERVRDDGVVVAPAKEQKGVLAIPFEDIAKETAGGKIYANTVAVGALAGVLGMLDILHNLQEIL